MEITQKAEVIIKGKPYPVEKFAPRNLLPALALLKEGIGDFKKESEFVDVLIEVMVPSIPDELLKKTRSGRLLLDITETELNLLLMQILAVHCQFSIDELTKNNAPQEEIDKEIEKLKEFQQGITFLNSGAIQVINELDSVTVKNLSEEEQEQKRLQSIEELQMRLAALQNNS